MPIIARKFGITMEIDDAEQKNSESCEFVASELEGSGFRVEKASFDLSAFERYKRVVEELVSKGISAKIEKRKRRISKDRTQIEYAIIIAAGSKARAIRCAAHFSREWAERELVEVDPNEDWDGEALKLVKRY